MNLFSLQKISLMRWKLLEQRQTYSLKNHWKLLTLSYMCTVWKMFVLRVILVHIFPYSDWVRRNKVRIWIYSDLHFPAFGLNTEKYTVCIRIQSECGKIRTRIIPNTDTFYAAVNCLLHQTTIPHLISNQISCFQHIHKRSPKIHV